MIDVSVQNITGAKARTVHSSRPFSTLTIRSGDGEVALYIEGADHFAKASAIADAINAAVAPAQERAA